LIEQAQYLEAVAKFRAAYSKWNNPKIRLNLATTLRALGRLSEALEGYEVYLLEAEPSEERRQEVERICSELRQQVARVELDVGPGVKALLLDARRLNPPSTGPRFLDPGHHVLVVEGPTGQRTIRFHVSGGEERRLKVRAGESIAARHPAAVVDTPATEQEAPRRRALGIMGRVDIDGSGRGAVGAVGLGYALHDHWEISAGGMKGGNAGAWGGTQVLLLDGGVSPTLGVSVPVFFLDSPYVGASAEAGTRFRLGDTLSVSARVACVYFPRVPPDYLSTMLVGSVGMGAWL
jgi:hypothetical protein